MRSPKKQACGVLSHVRCGMRCLPSNNRRQYGQLYLIDDGGFRIVGRPDKSAVGIMAHGQICALLPHRAARSVLGQDTHVAKCGS